jgi:hypothetical protein
MRKVIALAILWSVCSYAHQEAEPDITLTLRLDEVQMKQLCQVILMHAYASNNASQMGEKRAKEIVEKIFKETK